jgi:multiple sugar transport system ATP-binding protein
MGRDISIVASHEASENAVIRAIISADSNVNPTSRTVRFSIKPNKVFVFDRTTQERIRITR